MYVDPSVFEQHNSSGDEAAEGQEDEEEDEALEGSDKEVRHCYKQSMAGAQFPHDGV